MTKHVLVSIRDRAAETFGFPYCVPHAGVAMRTFINEVNRIDERNALNTNPEDFELYHLGLFDDATGQVEMFQRPELQAVGKDVKRTVQ